MTRDPRDPTLALMRESASASRPAGPGAPRSTTASHEDRVSAFYSHGAAQRAREADGFLSFGYWQSEDDDYLAAAERLFELVLDRVGLGAVDRLLNVCCGNGAETVRLCTRFRPSYLRAVDITGPHVEAARRKLADAGIPGDIAVERGDACHTRYRDGSFTHVVGIEGPAHFNTRRDFFAECHRLLAPGGVLVLSDIIAGQRYPRSPRSFAGRVASFTASLWHVPVDNQVPLSTYRRQLETAGFEVEVLETIGDRVFPGFARYNVRRAAVAEAIRVRGMAVGLGLTMISWLLGYASRAGMVDYVVVKAVRLPGATSATAAAGARR